MKDSNQNSDHVLSDFFKEGRRLFSSVWEFETSVTRIGQLAKPEKCEIAFAGRSNVGKSSLINALTNRRNLARISNTPGRTQMLNFFVSTNCPVKLVDMPGYGYAEAPKKTVETWTKLIFDYLRGRENLQRLFLLIDSRHGIKGIDLGAMNTFDQVAVVYQIVLTKTDKVKTSHLSRIMEETEMIISKRPAAFPEIIQTSSKKMVGIDELRTEIAKLVHNRH